MTREEQIRNYAINNCIQDDIDDTSYELIIETAEWADETMIDKACEWLELHINDDKYYSCIGEETLIPYLIEDFKQAMEE